MADEIDHEGPPIKWWWGTSRRLAYLVWKVEQTTGIKVEVFKFGSHKYEFHMTGEYGEWISFTYSDDEALGFIHGLEMGIRLEQGLARKRAREQ